MSLYIYIILVNQLVSHSKFSKCSFCIFVQDRPDPSLSPRRPGSRSRRRRPPYFSLTSTARRYHTHSRAEDCCRVASPGSRPSGAARNRAPRAPLCSPCRSVCQGECARGLPRRVEPPQLQPVVQPVPQPPGPQALREKNEAGRTRPGPGRRSRRRFPACCQPLV